jgi:hypothetical protein
MAVWRNKTNGEAESIKMSDLGPRSVTRNRMSDLGPRSVTRNRRQTYANKHIPKPENEQAKADRLVASRRLE